VVAVDRQAHHRAGHKNLVSNGIEYGASQAFGLPSAGQPAIEKVGDRRHCEAPEGEPEEVEGFTKAAGGDRQGPEYGQGQDEPR
jgi:hypothetical protein